jgi:hypothetical protein
VVVCYNRARNFDPVHLKDGFRNIKTNRANLAHGRLPSMWLALTQPPYGTWMPQSGRRSTTSFATETRRPSDRRADIAGCLKRANRRHWIHSIPRRSCANSRCLGIEESAAAMAMVRRELAQLPESLGLCLIAHRDSCCWFSPTCLRWVTHDGDDLDGRRLTSGRLLGPTQLPVSGHRSEPE